MNRNWVQIFVGAAALTGAFFFGSVMQRRHGDLDKKVGPQPMLENEDLVWQSTPPLTTEEPGSRPQPMVSGEETTAKHGEATAARGSSDASQQPATDSHSPKFDTEEQVTRKVVQPDFSRWANTPQPEAGAESVVEAAPMLPLSKTPPLLEQPAQPTGPLAPPPTRSLEQSLALGMEPTPEYDPWTAPLSSVLLKPPVTRTEETRNPAGLSDMDTRAQGTTPAPMLPTPPGPTTSPNGPTPQASNAALVPVSQQGTRKVEIDTDSFRIHVVRAGDTLQSIAQKYYGKADFYLDIYLANQDQLTSPINLPAGKALKIPDYSK